MPRDAPSWLLGRQITQVLIQPCAVDPDSGVVTVGVTTPPINQRSLRGRIDNIRIVNDVGEENIMSVDSTLANHVVTSDDLEIELTEILANGKLANTVTTATAFAPTKGAPILPQLPTLADLFKITFARGGQQWITFVTRGRQTDGVASIGKNVTGMTFRLADVRDSTLITTANPLGQFGIGYGNIPS